MGEGDDILACDGDAFFMAQQVLEQRLQRNRHGGEVNPERLPKRGKAVKPDLVIQAAKRAKRVAHGLPVPLLHKSFFQPPVMIAKPRKRRGSGSR